MNTHPLDFVNFSRVPDRVLNSAEGAHIKARLTQMKQDLGSNLLKVELFPNAGHVTCGSGEVLSGAVYIVKSGTPLNKLMAYLGPLYQHATAINLGKVSDEAVDRCKKAWKDIIDVPSARGSGHPELGVNVHAEHDILEQYRNRGNNSEASWFTSIGNNYPSFAMLLKNQYGDRKLLLAGGHDHLNSKLLDSIGENTKIEDIAEKNYSFENGSNLHSLIQDIKNLQKINHSAIALNVMNALEGKPTTEKQNTFKSQLNLNYSCFFNTVHEITRSRNPQQQVFAIAQGLVDVSTDVSSSDPKNMDLFMIENPKRAHQISLHKEEIKNVVKYFPITTGSSVMSNIGMADSEKESLSQGVHTCGISSVHDFRATSFQPYDVALKNCTNLLFGGKAYSVISGEQSMEADVTLIHGMDPRNITTKNTLDLTKHLDDHTKIALPANSEPIRKIFDTFPKVVEDLKQNGRKIQLFNMIQTHDESPYFVQLPVGALRHATRMSQENKKENKKLQFGCPRIAVDN